MHVRAREGDNLGSFYGELVVQFAKTMSCVVDVYGGGTLGVYRVRPDHNVTHQCRQSEQQEHYRNGFAHTALTGGDGVWLPLPLITDNSLVYSVVGNRGEPPLSKPTDLVQGTLDLLILKVVALEPMHGWAIAQRIKQMSRDVLQVGQGSLYPALHKLEQQGWIEAEWGESDNNRRAKYYSLTRAGRKALDQESAHWERLSAAISVIVRAT
jgi:transcriptional regulator